MSSLRLLAKSESNVEIDAERTVSVIGLDRVRKRVQREVAADPSLDVPEELHISGVAERIRANTEGAARVPVRLEMEKAFPI
jgi:hypothetical protein